MDERDPVQLLAGEQSRLAQELQDLPTTVWAAPSRCAGWNNARVVGHLAFHASVYRDSIARALTGDNAPPPGPDGQPQTRETFLSYADATETARSELPLGALLGDFSRSCDALMTLLLRLTPTDMDVPVWHYSGMLTIGVLVAYRLYELAFHGWDVRATVVPDAKIRPELCALLVGTVRQLLPWLCTPDSAIEATCRFEVGGQVWTTRIGDGKLAEVSDPGAPDATVRTDPSTFLLLATRRQTLADGVGQIDVEGSREVAEHMLGIGSFRI